MGETDRFCLLLTEHHGRVAARANGVRRLLSRRGSGLLPLHHISIVCDLHSFGLSIVSSASLHSHAQSWQDPHAFSCAQQGIELLLKLTEESSPMPQVYFLTCDFIDACALQNPARFPPLFTLKLLSMLGVSPSLTHSSIDHRPLPTEGTIVFSHRLGGLVDRRDDPAGVRLSPDLLHLFHTLEKCSLPAIPDLSRSLLAELTMFVHCLTGSQLGLSLRAPDVSLAMSSGVTPT